MRKRLGYLMCGIALLGVIIFFAVRNWPERIHLPGMPSEARKIKSAELSPPPAEQYNFRKTRWGMSIEEVKKAEIEKPSVEGDGKSGHILGYKNTIDGKDVMVGYTFMNSRLVQSSYSFKNQHTNTNLYIDDFK